MATAGLRAYDGSAGVIVDTKVWVDCMHPASRWHDWAIEQLQACSERSPLHVNLIIYTELLVPEPDVAALDPLLDVYDTLRSPMPWACAGLAARAFTAYRRRGGLNLGPCPISTSARMPPWPSPASSPATPAHTRATFLA